MLGGLLDFHFMQNAYLAGTLVALLAGAAGYFVVLRGQSFAAHMLSQVGFPGAAAAVLLGLSPVLGLVAFCAAAALAIAWMGRDVEAGSRVESAATALQLTARPLLGLGLSVALALAVTWLGLALAYFSDYPVGFLITSLAFGLYALVRASRAVRSWA